MPLVAAVLEAGSTHGGSFQDVMPGNYRCMSPTPNFEEEVMP